MIAMRPSLPVALACITLAGCVVAPVPAPGGTEPVTRSAARKAAPASVVTGTVLAPANLIGADGGSLVGADGATVLRSGAIQLIGNDGGTLIGNDAGSLIGNDGGTLIGNDAGSLKLAFTRLPSVASDDGPSRPSLASRPFLRPGDRSTYRLAQAAERRVAGAEVFLADAAGNPIPGLAAVKSDATGKFTFPRVPAGFAFQLVATFGTTDGRTGRLTTLVRPGELGATAPVGAETTLAATAVLGGLSGGIGRYDEGAFAKAVAITRERRGAKALPDWTSITAVAAEVDRLTAEVAELRSVVDQLREELRQVQSDLADVRGAVAELEAERRQTPPPASAAPSPAPAPPTPAAAAVETFSLPAGFMTRTDQAAATWSGWRYGWAAPGAPDGAFTPFTWIEAGGAASNRPGYADPASRGAHIVYGPSPLIVHPDENHDVLVAWRPGRAGAAELVGRAQVPQAQSDGVVLTIFVAEGDAVRPVAAPAQIAGGAAHEFRAKDLRFEATTTLYFRLGRNGTAAHDSTTFAVDVRFTPR